MTRGSDFFVRIASEKPGREWVVFLPGAGATSAVWFLQLRAFSKQFNVALVDLPGHGRHSRSTVEREGRQPYQLDRLIEDLDDAVQKVGILRSHVVALSLGTIFARGWAARHPERLRSVVLAGTIADLPTVARSLLEGGWYLRRVVPYMLLYRVYAWIIMPGRIHRATRRLFCRDARQLGRTEFNRWFDLAHEFVAALARLRHSPARLPTLHVMGEHDHMFLRPALALARHESADIRVVRGVGHVCSVEAPNEFNAIVLDFIGHISAIGNAPA